MTKILTLLCLVLFSQCVLWAEDDELLKNGIFTSRDLVAETKEEMLEHRFLKRVYPLIFKEGDAEPYVPELDQDFALWSGKTISKINVLQKDVFEIKPQREGLPLYNDVLRFGNMIHPKTRNNILKQNLFFVEGDTLNPALLIANLHYLYDSELYSELEFEITDPKQPRVGVDIKLREKFFLKFAPKLIDHNKLQLTLVDRNFLGLTHSINYSLYVDPQKRDILGWESFYTHPNILRKYIKGDFHRLSLPDDKRLDIAFNREFLYPLMNNFGGIDYRASETKISFWNSRLKYHQYGAWFAHTYSVLDYPEYIYSALSVRYRKHQIRPEELAWQNSFFALGTIGYASPEYRYVSGLSSFLDNNYLPKGHLLQVMAGHDFAEWQNRQYMGVQWEWSSYHNAGHYLYNKISTETYLSNGKAGQTLFAMEPVYITPMRLIGRFGNRGMIRARIIGTSKSYPTQRINLAEDQFYRDGEDLSGTDLASLSIEEDINTSFQIIGFQISAFTFMDMAAVHHDDKLHAPDRLFAQGFGIRLRNPSLIWDFIELRLTMEFLNANKPSFGFALSLKPTKALDGFSGRRPQTYFDN
ncbi:MAG: hypothetical protein PHN71_08270 [Candidatus Cloacimonetes bacterium]|nr:hypothetical protein [Candidatus Cloacimonadota bacterium]